MKKALLGQLADTDIRLLRIFRVVADCGGFTAAELELNIGRSTISRHIKDLETRLGVVLCRRGRGGFALTSEGRQVYEATLRVMSAIDDFRGEISIIQSDLSGTLVLALFDKTVTNPDAAITAALALFDESAPLADIEIHVQPLNEIERGVIDGKYHVGIIPGHRASSSLLYTELFNECVSLYCGASHPFYDRLSTITDRDIAATHYAGLGYHSPNMELGHRLGLVRKATAYDQEAVAHLILSGRYLGHLPEHYALAFEEEKKMRAITLPDYSYNCPFFAIVRREPVMSPLASRFLESLVECHHNKKQR